METLSIDWLKSNSRVTCSKGSELKDFFHPPWEGEAPLTLEWLRSLKPINYETILITLRLIDRNPDPRFHTPQWDELLQKISTALDERSRKTAMTWRTGPEPPRRPLPNGQSWNEGIEAANQALFEQTAQPLLDALHAL